MNRIGVYICACGPNIRNAVNIDELLTYSRTLPGVVFSRLGETLCSAESQLQIAGEIASEKLTHIVVAGCSPKEHEITFQTVLESAGLNPFFVQMASIREQCAWVTPDRTAATEKAKILIAAAVIRVTFCIPLIQDEIPVCTDLLIVGAGICGITAALTAAGDDRRVYLIESLPCIGGKVARFETVFPGGECAACLLDPLMDEVLHHDHITVLTSSRIVMVRGDVGNFRVDIHRQAETVSKTSCLGCGACMDVCPAEAPNPFNEGLDTRKAIYIPYPGALPNVAVIDPAICLHFTGKNCTACQDVCPFGAIDFAQTDNTEEIHVGGILLATGCDLAGIEHLPHYGYGTLPDVYTSMEFERLVCTTGPTEGKLILKNGEIPRRIALVLCTGSRTAAFKSHCSVVCCRYMLKFAELATHRLPDVSIQVFFSDWCLPGMNRKVLPMEQVQFHRMAAPDRIGLHARDDGIGIRWEDVCGRMQEDICDMVVLAPPLTGSEGADFLSECLEIQVDGNGFFLVDHPITAPVSTLREGVWVAGCAKGPCSAGDAAAQGLAAAGRMLSCLVPGRTIRLSAGIAQVDSARCSGCGVCVDVCPYGALSLSESGAVIQKTLCKGCGTCVPACPSAAIVPGLFSDQELTAEIAGLLNQSHLT